MLPGLAGIAGFSSAAAAGGGSSPSYVATSTHSANSIAPSYPSGIQAGDLLLGFVVGNGTSSLAYSGPSGFTQLAQFVVTDPDGLFITLAVFEKIADGSETGAATFTVTAGFQNSHGAAVSRFTGATGTESVVTGSTSDHATTPISSPVVTTLGANRLVVNFFACSRSSSLAEEAGFTEGFDYTFNGAGASDYCFAMHYLNASGIGAQTTEEPTPSFTTCAFGMISLALKP